MKELLDRLEEQAQEVARLKGVIADMQAALVRADAALEAKIVKQQVPLDNHMLHEYRAELSVRPARDDARAIRALIENEAATLCMSAMRSVDVFIPRGLTTLGSDQTITLALDVMKPWRRDMESHQASPLWAMARQVLR